jgi:NTE family protein
MSVPLLWEEVIWQAGWGPYRGSDLAGHSIVDGGLLSNFPIELLVSTDAQVRNVMGEKPNDKVMGFLIDETLEVPGAPALPGSAVFHGGLSEFATVRRLQGLVNTATQAHDRGAIDAFEHLVVRLPARGFGTTEFDMLPERRAAIIAAGRATAETYLRRLSSRSIEQPPTDTDLANRRARRMLDE